MVHPGPGEPVGPSPGMLLNGARSSLAAAGAGIMWSLDMHTSGRLLRRVSLPAHRPLRPGATPGPRVSWPSRLGASGLGLPLSVNPPVAAD